MQYLLREVVSDPAQAVGVKEFARVGESCSNAIKLLISLHSARGTCLTAGASSSIMTFTIVSRSHFGISLGGRHEYFADPAFSSPSTPGVSMNAGENEMPRCDLRSLSIEDVGPDRSCFGVELRRPSEELRRSAPSEDGSTEMDSFRELAISVESRRSELLSEYPDQWIAVSRDGVVATADTRIELFDLLSEKRIRPKDVYHDFLDTTPRTLLL